VAAAAASFFSQNATGSGRRLSEQTAGLSRSGRVKSSLKIERAAWIDETYTRVCRLYLDRPRIRSRQSSPIPLLYIPPHPRRRSPHCCSSFRSCLRLPRRSGSKPSSLAFLKAVAGDKQGEIRFGLFLG
jgi:hypothetical protein